MLSLTDTYVQLADVMESELGISVNVNSIFAAQIKRLHEVCTSRLLLIFAHTSPSTRGKP